MHACREIRQQRHFTDEAAVSDFAEEVGVTRGSMQRWVEPRVLT